MSFHSPPEKYSESLNEKEYAIWLHGLNCRIYIERFEKEAMAAIEGKPKGAPIQITMIMNKIYIVDITDVINEVFPHMNASWVADDDDFWYTLTIRWLKV